MSPWSTPRSSAVTSCRASTPWAPVVPCSLNWESRIYFCVCASKLIGCFLRISVAVIKYNHELTWAVCPIYPTAVAWHPTSVVPFLTYDPSAVTCGWASAPRTPCGPDSFNFKRTLQDLLRFWMQSRLTLTILCFRYVPDAWHTTCEISGSALCSYPTWWRASIPRLPGSPGSFNCVNVDDRYSCIDLNN